MRQVNKRAIAAAVLTLALSACNTMQRDLDHQTGEVTDQVSNYNRLATVQAASSNVRVVQRVSGAWLGGRAVPMTASCPWQRGHCSGSVMARPTSVVSSTGAAPSMLRCAALILIAPVQ